jgi:predicted phosphohydrolase
VRALKEVIKDANPESFHNVDARSLRLWKVATIPVNGDFKESVGKIELREEDRLSPVERLSKFFVVQPEEGILHIMVHSPPASKYKSLVVSSHLSDAFVSTTSSTILPSFGIQAAPQRSATGSTKT